MVKILNPAEINEAFARAFNGRQMEGLLALYEEDAALCTDLSTTVHRGHAQIAAALAPLLAGPGRMRSINNFCIELGAIALLRADYTLLNDDGTVILQGASAEIVRRQRDGSWRYAIDHATALLLPSVLDRPLA